MVYFNKGKSLYCWVFNMRNRSAKLGATPHSLFLYTRDTYLLM